MPELISIGNTPKRGPSPRGSLGAFGKMNGDLVVSIILGLQLSRGCLGFQGTCRSTSISFCDSNHPIISPPLNSNGGPLTATQCSPHVSVDQSHRSDLRVVQLRRRIQKMPLLAVTLRARREAAFELVLNTPMRPMESVRTSCCLFFPSLTFALFTSHSEVV
ncbi:hypothetical protein FA13DRAFT_707881 [Coprinellus micaceus]|uniref:Uncharacterized protein n=1 Tax=Coprinellus micaceus TaxID=71717 RepID=A0A4Y7TUE0_COPMI|nr:hypothetical protein FA13DRAFT_707881 [Coprinellus micaceus]